MTTAAGVRAWMREREREATERKKNDMVKVMRKLTNRKKKYGPGSRLRCDMK